MLFLRPITRSALDALTWILLLYWLIAFGWGSVSGQVYQNLFSFTNSNATGADRSSTPGAPLILGIDGNFYGTTVYGGTHLSGTVFKMTPDGTVTTLVDFTGSTSSTDLVRGASPEAALVQGSDGNFYGTTQLGGLNGSGTVFKMTPKGTVTTLVDFGSVQQMTNGSRGSQPMSPLVQGNDGNFYGTTSGGGIGAGSGTVFELNPNAAYGQNITTLADFTASTSPTDQSAAGSCSQRLSKATTATFTEPPRAVESIGMARCSS